MLDVALVKQIMARPQVFSVFPTQKLKTRKVHLRENILECGMCYGTCHRNSGVTIREFSNLLGISLNHFTAF
jgi:hypothetical protein